jgi:hypothetical protein
MLGAGDGATTPAAKPQIRREAQQGTPMGKSAADAPAIALPDRRWPAEARDSLAFAALLSVMLHVALLGGLALRLNAPARQPPAPEAEITLASPADFARDTAPPAPKAPAQAPPDERAKAEAGALNAPPPAPSRDSEKAAGGWVQSREPLSTRALAEPRNRKALASLQRLEPQTRLHQICDFEAILQINRLYPDYGVDFVVAYATEDAVRSGATLIAHGAAFHRAGEWRRLAFECQVAANQRDVASLKFKIGDAIPPDQWSDLNLPKSPAPLGDD